MWRSGEGGDTPPLLRGNEIKAQTAEPKGEEISSPPSSPSALVLVLIHLLLLLLRMIASLGDDLDSPQLGSAALVRPTVTGAPGRRGHPAARSRPGSQLPLICSPTVLRAGDPNKDHWGPLLSVRVCVCVWAPSLSSKTVKCLCCIYLHCLALFGLNLLFCVP